MPQKKNPDAAELLRAKAPRVVGRLTTLHGVLHGLPLTYNKDLQEDKEQLFDAIDTVELCLRVAGGMLETITFDRERLAAAAADEFPAATDIADLLVKRGVPFRQAHGIVGGRGPGRGRAGQGAVRAHRGRAGRARAAARRRVLRAARARAPGSSRRSPRAARRWRACATSWPRRATCSRRRRAADDGPAGPAEQSFYDRPVARGGARPRRLRAAPRRHRRAGSSRPRPTTRPSPPVTPTSG